MGPASAACPLTLALTAEELEVLAFFLKRAGYSTYRAHAQTEDEGYAMFAAAEKLRQALTEVGFNPR